MENIFNLQFIWDQASIVIIALAVAGIIKFIVSPIKKLTKSINAFIETQEKQTVAIRNILKTLIVLVHDDAIEKSFINKYKLEVTERLYASYKDLNGNSYVEDLMKELRSLTHIRKPKDELEK